MKKLPVFLLWFTGLWAALPARDMAVESLVPRGPDGRFLGRDEQGIVRADRLFPTDWD